MHQLCFVKLPILRTGSQISAKCYEGRLIRQKQFLIKRQSDSAKHCITVKLTAINGTLPAAVKFNTTELKLTFHCVTNDDANIELQGFETDYPVIPFHFLLAKKEGRTQEYNNRYLIQCFMNH